jgi:hypothetical protein
MGKTMDDAWLWIGWPTDQDRHHPHPGPHDDGEPRTPAGYALGREARPAAGKTSRALIGE